MLRRAATVTALAVASQPATNEDFYAGWKADWLEPVRATFAPHRVEPHAP